MATGLSRLEVTRLEHERRAENESATRAALREMEQRLDNTPAGQGRDALERRIALVRGEEEPEEGDWRQSSLPTLATPWGQA